MKIIELILDEENEDLGVTAISVVENPAIEEQFLALKSQEFNFAKQDQDKRLLVGAALVPNKPIYRKNKDEEYYINFTKDTVRNASEMFFKKGHQSSTTLEHDMKLEGLTVVESWIVESEKDKSRHYGLNVPEGTWMISMKVENDEVWNDYIKTNKLKGFSIEAFMSDRMQRPKDKTLSEILQEIEEEEAEFLSKKIVNLLNEEEIEFESYSDYPDAVKNNAKRGRELNEKVNNKCATMVGKVRSASLAQGKPIQVDTIKRMYSFLSRAGEYYDESDSKACGTISYLLWGGKAGLRWATSKLKELGEIDLQTQVINDDYAIIDDRLAYSTEEKAKEMAANIGCEGFHTHELVDPKTEETKTWYMPCEQHKMTEEEFKKYKCPPGYKKDYQKHKCVKMNEEELAEVGPRGGIRKSPKAPKSGTPNPKPKGKGTAKGDASTSRGAKVSKADQEKLQKKSDDFNERYKKKLGYGVTIGQLKSVFQRGLGAFNTSHSPRIKSPTAWAMARVNAYLYLVKNGRPQNPKYKGDFDLLPAKHPKSMKK